MRSDRLTILLSGMIAADPHQGGATWAVLQYLLGLRRLGHRVFFVEPVKPSSLRPPGASLEQSANAAYFRQVTAEFGLEATAALVLAGTRRSVGLPYERLRDAALEADLLLNVSGLLKDDALVSHIPVRIYLDLDPAFTQLWHAQGTDVGLRGHTHYVTIGCNIGRAGCGVPTCGLDWITTLQPLVLAEWPAAEGFRYDAFTTVGHWRSYGTIEQDGVLYGQKAHSLRQLIRLPTMTSERFLLALGIHPDEKNDLAALAAHGWQLLDPARVAATPAGYRGFIQQSKAEFGIAKSGYVAARCGWFSDRSLCYLASARPVIAHDTGFSRFLPTGEGLFAFETCDDVLAAIDAIKSDYGRHARAARALAEAYFDSDRVLSRLFECV